VAGETKGKTTWSDNTAPYGEKGLAGLCIKSFRRRDVD